MTHRLWSFKSHRIKLPGLMKETICKKFGQRVRSLREERGYSQEAFAEIVGIDRTYISGIERGVRNPTLTSIAKIAAALKISVSKLLEGI